MDLLIELDPSRGRQAGLEDALRRAVTSGQLAAGARLPSTRALSKELGCARATVVAAYEQLIAEGFLVAAHGAGTRIASVPISPQPRPDVGARGTTYLADFRPGEPARSSFPRAQWGSSIRRALAGATDDLFGYGDPRGVPQLRAALATYLGRARAVVADPDQIVIFSGFANALVVLTDTLRDLGRTTIAIEDPALPIHPHLCTRAGMTVERVIVDAHGVQVDALARTSADAVLVTPAHQYPLGVALAPSRRTALVGWARATDGWIIEDDYDGEFRYDRQPIGAMQGLDPDRVVYGGTASKTLAAGVHLAWLVLPRRLVEPVVETVRWREGVSAIEQAALADFIATGRLDRHLRQMRAVYRRRRDALVAVLQAHAPWMEMTGISAGLHGTVELDGPVAREREILDLARSHSVGLHPLSAHRSAPGPPGLVIGYSRPAAHELSGALARLGQLVSSLSG
ncbi:MAG TPA: PLP-dependent aminotransferase family protein [Acidimicrobiales bacterium]|nr:PLP-dependent aminotransferase family protein [Acidimicrobiales bacterium]